MALNLHKPLKGTFDYDVLLNKNFQDIEDAVNELEEKTNTSESITEEEKEYWNSKQEALSGDIDGHNHDSMYLSKDNQDEYTPNSDYQPATKKYVDDEISDNKTPIVDNLNSTSKASALSANQGRELNALIINQSIETNNRIGQANDDLLTGNDEQAGSTVFGGLNRIWNYLKTQISASIGDNLTNIKTLLGTANPTASNSNTVMNFLNTILNAINNKSPIKSVQRGIVRVVEPDTTQIQIAISTVNPAKCQVLLDGWWLSGAGSTGRTWPPYLYSLTATTLIIKGNTSVNSSAISEYKEFSWQVIEFN